MSRPVARLAERVWRLPLLVAAVLLVACGPATSWGRLGLVQPAALAAVALTALAVPLGLLALRSPVHELDTEGQEIR